MAEKQLSDEVIDKVYLFTGMFVESFERYFEDTSNIADGKLKPKTNKLVSGTITATDKVINGLLKNFGVKIPFEEIVNKIYDEKKKKEASKVVRLFHADIQKFRDELVRFCFEVFRCFESVLAAGKVIDMINVYKVWVEKMQKKIFQYYENKKVEKIIPNADDFMDAFFNQSNSLTKNVGILVIDSSSKNIVTYYNNKDIGENTDTYRLLNHNEMKSLSDMDGEDWTKKLSELLKSKFMEAKNVDYNPKFTLKDRDANYFCITFRLKMCCDNTGKYDLYNFPDTSKGFVERQNPLTEIFNYFKHGNVIVVTGLEGAGKTKIAEEVGLLLRNTMNIFWIDGTDESTIESSVKKIFCQCFSSKSLHDELSAKCIINDIYDKFRQTDNLFIFDNVQMYERIEKYLPKSLWGSNFKTLVTSYTKLWNCKQHELKLVHLENMDVEESVTLFKTHTKYLMAEFNYQDGFKLIDSDTEIDEDINSLMNNMSRLPFLILHATKCIYDKFRRKSLSGSNTKSWKRILSDEINFYRENHSDMSTEIIHREIVGRIFDDSINYDKNSKEYAVYNAAKEFFNVLSLCAPRKIPLMVLEKFCFDCCSLDCSKADKEDFYANVLHFLIKNFIVEQSDYYRYLRLDDLMWSANENNLTNGNESLEHILITSLKCVVACVPKINIDTETVDKTYAIEVLNDFIPHIVTIWKRASNYENIVKQFIMKVDENKLSITYFLHIISQYSETCVVRDVINIIQKSNQSVIEKILMKENFSHRTPLHCAAEGGQLETVKMFMELCPKIIPSVNEKIKKCKKQWTPLHLAVKNGHKDVVEFLLNQGHTNGGCSNMGFTPMHLAAVNGQFDIMKVMFNKEHIEEITDFRFTPLHLACQKNHFHIVRYLLEEGANYAATTGFAKTPLHFAADNGQEEIVKRLLEYDKKKEVTKITENKSLFLPLHWAALNGHSSIVQLLLEHDVSVIDEQTSEGNTALHLACKHDQLDVIKVLVKFNPKTDILNHKKKCALDLAQNDDVRSIVSPQWFQRMHNLFS